MGTVLAQVLCTTSVSDFNKDQKQETLVLSTNETIDIALAVRFKSCSGIPSHLLQRLREVDVLSAPVLDEEALTTVGIVDVLDILKVFSESYKSDDTLDEVRAKWREFTTHTVKEVFGECR